MEKLKIAICEDDDAEYEKLIQILEKCSCEYDIKRFTDGRGLLAGYYHGCYDLLLLDIYMNGMNGLETAAAIRELDPDIPLAFLTLSLDHAMDGYRYHVNRYITKPLHYEEVAEVVSLAVRYKNAEPAINVSFDRNMQRIALSRIRYLESQGDKVLIYLTGGEVVKTTLKMK